MRPPSTARRLWRRLAPDRIADDVLDELDEEFRRYKLPELGPLRAGLWYWYQIVGTLIAVHTRYRRTLRPRRPSPWGREGREWTLITSLGQDLRTAVRMLRKAPSFTAFSVATLAIGIGATSAIFSVVDAVLLTPLPYDRPEELVVVGGRRADTGSADLKVSGPEYVDFLKSTSLQDVGAAYVIDANLTGGDRPERVTVALVTHDFFPMLGAAPAIGRDFESDDAGVDIGYVVILSHGAWERMYGGDPAAIGATVELDEDPITVIGVMPEGFSHPAQSATVPVDAWVPFDPTSSLFENRRYRPLDLYGRLREGTDVAESQSEFRAIAQGLRELHADVYPAETEWDVAVVPLLDRVVGDVRATLLVLFGAVAFVLLVACTNVANLLLTRGSTRTREFAIRAALGAGRLRLAKQALIESLVLGLAGGAVGLTLAQVGSDALRNLVATDFPRVQDATIDGRVLLFTLLASLVASLVFGMAPMLRFSDPDLRLATAEGGRGSSGAHSRTRDGLVVAQIAVSLVLVISAGLMVKSFGRLLAVDPGFEPERVLALQVWLPRPNVPESGRFFRQEQRIELFDRALERMEAIPGVERAAVVSHLPLRATGSGPFELEGMDVGARREPLVAEIRIVSSGYFDVMGIPIERGRGIDAADDADAAPVVLVNEALADSYSPDDDPVARRIRFGSGPWRDVVGVVPNVRHQALDARPRPTIYLPYRQGVGRSMTFVLKTTGPPAAVAQRATEALQEVDRDLPVYGVASMDAVIADTVAQRRTLMLLLSLFAVQAMVLAAIGVYGVIGYATRQRRREIGIRLALGAERVRVIGMIVRQAAALGVAGVGVGLLGAAGTTRALQGFLFEVGRLDPSIFVGMALLWLGLAGLAALVPARGGARVHPAEVLRTD